MPVGKVALELGEKVLALEQLGLPRGRRVKRTAEEDAASDEDQPQRAHKGGYFDRGRSKELVPGQTNYATMHLPVPHLSSK